MKPPKYKVGQKVGCFREETLDVMGFSFSGIVKEINNTGGQENPDYEYTVTNAPIGFIGPILIWEEEIVGLVEK